MPSSFLQQIREGGQGTPLPTRVPRAQLLHWRAPPNARGSVGGDIRGQSPNSKPRRLPQISIKALPRVPPLQGARASIQVPALLYSPGSDSPGRIAQPGSKWHLG